MDRTSSARWEGDLKQGKGTFAVGGGTISAPYSWGTRFGDTPGTNPEELIAAAHAACFSMAFAADLSAVGFVPTNIETSATVHFNKGESGFAINGIDLDCKASAGNISPELLAATAQGAKKNCPISKALASVPIALKLNGTMI
jgi:osmotically inducible protein OsmC